MIMSEARARRYRQIRVLEVLRVAHVSANMRRITLGGAEIEGFGSGPNIKLLIPAPGIDRPHWPMAGPDGRAIWPADPYRPVIRTYSVRSFDAARGELHVDFVLHGDDGPASYWAARAKPGDVLGVGGPGGRSIAPADFYLFAGDHSALPAISAAIEALPGDARGQAFIEVPGSQDELPIQGAPGLSVIWLHRNGQPAGRTTQLQDAVRALAWPTDRSVFAWVGCESAAVRSIRAYVRDECGLDRRSIMAIGYWRLGLSEAQYNAELKNDRDADYFLAMKEELDSSKSLP
jgi:NADPH-dependent ferric siderophore reductase